jgi:hypothetical protein
MPYDSPISVSADGRYLTNNAMEVQLIPIAVRPFSWPHTGDRLPTAHFGARPLLSLLAFHRFQVLCTPLGPFDRHGRHVALAFAWKKALFSHSDLSGPSTRSLLGAADRLIVSILEEDWSRPFPMMSKQLQSRFMAHTHLISVGTTYPSSYERNRSLLYCISSSSFPMGGEGGSPSNPQPIIDSISFCTACASDGPSKIGSALQLYCYYCKCLYYH